MHAILLDVEGTTTPIRFVYDILFPYAREHLRPYLERNRSDPHVIDDLELLRREYDEDLRLGNQPGTWNAVTYCNWLMDRDRKSTALKSIQGKVWALGYKTGDLKGEVFPDVPPALKEWHLKGLGTYIFSSGSVLAQKLLFANTADGDLTPYLRGHFDTNTGPKTASESYLQISAAIRVKPNEVVFVSDVAAELDAARVSGMETLLCARPGNRAQPDHAHRIIEHFEEIS